MGCQRCDRAVPARASRGRPPTTEVPGQGLRRSGAMLSLSQRMGTDRGEPPTRQSSGRAKGPSSRTAPIGADPRAERLAQRAHPSARPRSSWVPTWHTAHSVSSPRDGRPANQSELPPRRRLSPAPSSSTLTRPLARSPTSQWLYWLGDSRPSAAIRAPCRQT